MSVDQKDLLESHIKIQTKEDLALFVSDLKQNLKDHPETWENSDLYFFLDAMHSWIEAMEWYYKNNGNEMPESPSWQMIGDILMGARIYE